MNFCYIGLFSNKCFFSMAIIYWQKNSTLQTSLISGYLNRLQNLMYLFYHYAPAFPAFLECLSVCYSLALNIFFTLFLYFFIPCVISLSPSNFFPSTSLPFIYQCVSSVKIKQTSASKNLFGFSRFLSKFLIGSSRLKPIFKS